MPTGNLPKEAKAIWERVYNANKEKYGEERAAKMAWGAVKNAGWKKDKEGNWHKKAALTEFSLRIERASYDKATNERRWRAVCSDDEEDKSKDNMSLGLFADFIERIEKKESPPLEEFCTEFWCGGVPYLSVSHYPDLNGKGVPGPVDAVYVDGSYLKARGKFDDTPLGRACFEAVCADLYSEKSDYEDKVRISIAFLDWKHRHKKTDYIFERSSPDDICPECLAELILGNGEGREFLSGQLVHLAMTRIPMNERTNMEVERSMATQKEDATSIIGEELAEMLDAEEREALKSKSGAVVIRSDDELDEPDDSDDEEVVEEVPVPFDELRSMISELSSQVAELRSTIEKPVEKPKVHPLDNAFAKLRSAYDNAMNVEGFSSEDRLRALQEPINELGSEIVNSIRGVSIEEQKIVPEQVDLVSAFSEAIQPFAQKLDLLIAQQSQPVMNINPEIPQRRSIAPKPYIPNTLTEADKASVTPNLRQRLRPTVYGR